MNYDTLTMFRMQAEREIQAEFDARIQARYTELLEAEVLKLQQVVKDITPPLDTTDPMALVDVIEAMKLTELERIKILRAAFKLSLNDARRLLTDYLPF